MARVFGVVCDWSGTRKELIRPRDPSLPPGAPQALGLGLQIPRGCGGDLVSSSDVSPAPAITSVRLPIVAMPSPPTPLPSLLDFEGLLSFYLAFHSDATNQAIHVAFIPAIAWSLLVGVSRIPGVPAALLLSYTAYYTYLNAPLGITWGATLGTGLFVSSMTFAKNEPASAKIALGVHVASWIAQFIGHGVFERRAPSLFTGFLHSFLAAPFFVFVECAFKLGMLPELHKRVRARADKIRSGLDAARKKK